MSPSAGRVRRPPWSRVVGRCGAYPTSAAVGNHHLCLLRVSIVGPAVDRPSAARHVPSSRTDAAASVRVPAYGSSGVGLPAGHLAPASSAIGDRPARPRLVAGRGGLRGSRPRASVRSGRQSGVTSLLRGRTEVLPAGVVRVSDVLVGVVGVSAAVAGAATLLITLPAVVRCTAAGRSAGPAPSRGWPRCSPGWSRPARRYSPRWMAASGAPAEGQPTRPVRGWVEPNLGRAERSGWPSAGARRPPSTSANICPAPYRFQIGTTNRASTSAGRREGARPAKRPAAPWARTTAGNVISRVAAPATAADTPTTPTSTSETRTTPAGNTSVRPRSSNVQRQSSAPAADSTARPRSRRPRPRPATSAGGPTGRWRRSPSSPGAR